MFKVLLYIYIYIYIYIYFGGVVFDFERGAGQASNDVAINTDGIAHVSIAQ